MNRRDLIKRGPLALLGIAGAVLGVKAEPERQPVTITVTVNNNDRHIVDVIAKDYAAGGRIREMTLRDGPSNASLYSRALLESDVRALYEMR